MTEYFSCCQREYTLELLKKITITAKGDYIRQCRDCLSGNPVLHDVFIGNSSGGIMYEENIADKKTGEPIPFYDKASKVAAMKQAGVHEAGDRIHGHRNEDNLKRRTYI